MHAEAPHLGPISPVLQGAQQRRQGAAILRPLRSEGREHGFGRLSKVSPNRWARIYRHTSTGLLNAGRTLVGGVPNNAISYRFFKKAIPSSDRLFRWLCAWYEDQTKLCSLSTQVPFTCLCTHLYTCLSMRFAPRQARHGRFSQSCWVE